MTPIRVVELTAGIAGAYCGKLLADAGAQVTMVEPEGGHPLRRRRPVAGARPGALFEFLSEAKEIRSGDPSVPFSGLFSELISEADVVLVDGRPELPDVAPPFTISFSPFGLDGPWADRPATEFVIQAMCGSTGKRGLPGRPPVHAGGAPVEFAAGSYAAAAVSCFMWSAGDAPRHLDVSLLEAGAVTMHAFVTIDASFRGERSRPPRTTQIPSIEPTADGYIGFSTITAQQFTDFLHMIGRPDLAADESLLIPDERQRRREELVGAIRTWTGKRTNAEIVEMATAFRIPVAPIGNGANLPANEHLRERGAFRRTAAGLTAPRRPYLLTEGRATPGPGARWSGGGTGRLPLEGLKVADFTAFWAGPAATHLLAALGADVVKVESPARPDGMRYTSSRPGAEDWLEYSAVFFGVNANKRSVTLDLRNEEDRGKAERLIGWADVVAENFSPRVLDDFGFGFERINRVNPSAVLVRMPAFGLTGPWRDRTGFAMTVEQASGMAWQTGYADGPPMDVGGVCDPLCGMHAVVALMDALRRRAGTGRGMLVEVPLVEVALNVAAEQVLQHSMDGVVVGRDSNRGPEGAPQGVYPASGEDRWIALSVRDDGEWEQLRDVLGSPDWTRDADLATRDGRFAAEARVDEGIAAWSVAMDPEAAVKALLRRGIPAAVVATPPEVADLEQLRARGFFEPVVHPVAGEREIPSLPFRPVGEKPAWYRTPPPTVGQHTAEVEATILGSPYREGA